MTYTHVSPFETLSDVPPEVRRDFFKHMAEGNLQALNELTKQIWNSKENIKWLQHVLMTMGVRMQDGTETEILTRKQAQLAVATEIVIEQVITFINGKWNEAAKASGKPEISSLEKVWELEFRTALRRVFSLMTGNHKLDPDFVVDKTAVPVGEEASAEAADPTLLP
jgi:hypothetical protein